MVRHDRKHTPKKGIVVSDLHILGDYTHTDALLPLLDKAIERTQADMVVLNGDIFEFEYPNRRYTQDEVLRHALTWLREFCSKHPDTQVHYVMGNHDGVYHPTDKKRDFVRQLRTLERKIRKNDHSNFHFHPEYFLAASNSLFTHGDIPLRGQNMQSRSYTHIDETRVPPHTLYEVGTRLALRDGDLKLGEVFEQMFYDNKTLHRVGQRAVDIWNHHGRINPILARSLSGMVNGRHDAFHIFTGHTHIPRLNDPLTVRMLDADGREYKQEFLFHNTGSSVRSREFNMLEFDLRDIGKNDLKGKPVYVLENVCRAEEVGPEEKSWVQKVGHKAAVAACSAPLPRA